MDKPLDISCGREHHSCNIAPRARVARVPGGQTYDP